MIWLVALVALIAATFAIAVRLHVKAAANVADSARAEALADGLTKLIALQLAIEPTGKAAAGGSNAKGEPWYCRLTDDFSARIAVQDQGGLIDLNGASAELLERLFAAVGFEPVRAKRLAAAVVDFRDPDSSPLAHGAEEKDYRRAGLTHGPKNSAFHAVEELDQVLGFEPGEVGRLLPLVTVHSQAAGIDPKVAPSALLSMLELGGTTARRSGSSGFVSRSSGKALGIEVMVGSKTGGTFRRRAIVLITRHPNRPFAILDWRQELTVAGQDDRAALSSVTTLCPAHLVGSRAPSRSMALPVRPWTVAAGASNDQFRAPS